MVIRSAIFAWFASMCFISASTRAAEENDFYRIVSIATSSSSIESRSPNWKPSDDLALEVSGIAILDESRIAVAIRKGEIWTLGNVYGDSPDKVTYKLFASALHEPLGLLKEGESLLTTQRTELTRIRDLNHDGVADDYETITNDWGVTGHYHEYAYGPKRDGDGNLWVTLNIGMGLDREQLTQTVTEPTLGYRQAKWRGWGLKIASDGTLTPMCAGMRSPSGLGVNADGDMFYTDQQGNWVATNSLHHMRRGAFFHHAEALASMNLPGSTIKGVASVPDGLPLPKALEAMPQLKPPAVWFPYKKAGQSATDIMLDASGGKFGPFENQFFVGEFTQSSITRVFLEKVNGEYQGACFPFRSGFASAVLRLEQGVDGSVFVGLTNRGWSSLGTAAYGLQRLVWTGKTPFEIKEMRSQPDGFELVFTQPADMASASDPASYRMKSYTYLYHSTYGSDEIQTKSLPIQTVEVAQDGMSARLFVDGLREHFVHELEAPGLRSQGGQPLLHPQAFYTLNQIPSP